MKRHCLATRGHERVFLLSDFDEDFLWCAGVSLADLATYRAARVTSDAFEQLRQGNPPLQLFMVYDMAKQHDAQRRLFTSEDYLTMLRIIYRSPALPVTKRMALEEEMMWTEHDCFDSPLVPFRNIESLYQTLYPRAYLRMIGHETI